MAKKEKLQKGNGARKEKRPGGYPESLLTSWTKRWIRAILMFLLTIVVVLSFPFFDKAGSAGRLFVKISIFLIGQTFFILPLFLFIGGLIFLKSRKKGRNLAMPLAILISIIGVAGILAGRDLTQMQGGWVGYLFAKLFIGLFGLLVANIIFGAVLLIGLFIFLQFIWSGVPKERPKGYPEEEKRPSFVLNRSETENLKIKGTDEERQKSMPARVSLFKRRPKGYPDEKEELKIKETKPATAKSEYILPPLDLLSKSETPPTSGNIKENSMLIKNTLENFGIPVEMAEVNVGPTVTQYAFKPAEGVKLSKITTLSNNLALALAAHPIRIEAPIPGKSLVGIEVPNKIRSTVSLRNLIANSSFQTATTPLLFVLGRNVSGSPVYADLDEMPHLLVAGATGTGKTFFLNNLILSLLYRCMPDNLRMIMVDPKRVEFQHYNDIPHLLCPVIYDATKTINALQWLTREMERRFEIFSEIPTRNIATYNQNKSIIASGMQLPYIVFIVDELADLMAAKGREIEAGVVRLAQMSRATGIHLVLATQRPSVEVITGLIKANITSRVTFQVASQVDSRTVLDIAGAEKLLGSGDMLFVSAKTAKIRRIQGPYISEKEVNKVAEFIAEQGKKIEEPQSVLVQNLKNALNQQDAKEGRPNGYPGEIFFGDDDPLFEDVKRIVLETKKASASFLQRKLRIGYSRAARLIDMLEEKGIVGPADGAKPREVYADKADFISESPKASFDKSGDTNDNEWQKV